MFIDGQGCTVSTMGYQFLVNDGAKLCLYNLNLRPGESSFGLNWEYVGTDEPIGRELTNTKLVNALKSSNARETTFTHAEWNAFGIKDLRVNDFVRTARRTFYQPIAVGTVHTHLL